MTKSSHKNHYYYSSSRCSFLVVVFFIFFSSSSSSRCDAKSISIQTLNNNNCANKHHQNQLTLSTRGGAKQQPQLRVQPPPKPNQETASSHLIIKTINPHYAVLHGMILSFNSGLINGITLSGVLSTIKQPSSAVTGSWTNSALSIARNDNGGGIHNMIMNNLGLQCIASYMGGSFIGGWMNPYPMNYSMKRNTVRPAFLIASLVMMASYVLLSSPSSFSSASTSSSLWILLALIANGIQNSITSSLTSNLMRSAHYSGMTSDIGTYIGQAVRGNKANGLKLKVFIVLAFSFWMGGYWSVGLLDLLGSKALLINVLIYLLFGIFSI